MNRDEVYESLMARKAEKIGAKRDADGAIVTRPGHNGTEETVWVVRKDDEPFDVIEEGKLTAGANASRHKR
jgi:hypothetical protein